MNHLLLTVNGVTQTTCVRDGESLVDVLYRHFGTSGRRSCEGTCAACIVHVDGYPVRACTTLVREVAGQDIVTLEGLSRSEGLPPTELHAVERAWRDERVPVCSCRSGLIMATAALLMTNPAPTKSEIDDALPMACGCGVNTHVYRVIRSLSEGMAHW